MNFLVAFSVSVGVDWVMKFCDDDVREDSL